MARRIDRRSFLAKTAVGGSAALMGPAIARALSGALLGVDPLGGETAEAASIVSATIGTPWRYNNLYPQHYDSGDTFYNAWSANGTLYINADDNFGWNGGYNSDTNLGTLAGDPNVPSTLVGSNVNPMNGSNGTINFWTIDTDGLSDDRTWKATSLYEVDNILYKGVYRQDNLSGYKGQWAKDASFIKSTDGGLNWTSAAGYNVAPGIGSSAMFPGAQFGIINFVHYGQGGAAPSPVVDAADQYVYAWSWETGSSPNGANLARCTRSVLMNLNPADWQFFTGLDGNQNPLWSSSMASAAHFYNGSEVTHGDMVYNQALGLYVWITYGGGYAVHTAPHPWGPTWSLVLHQAAPGAGNLQQPTLLHSYATSTSMWILSSGTPYDATNVHTTNYCLWTLPLTLVPSTETPYGNGGAAWPLPGTVQAENFDATGEGVAYHNSYGTNKGNSTYRSGETVSLEYCSEGGSDVCWNAPGNWLKYTVNVSAAGTYAFTARVASGQTGGAFHVEVDGNNLTGTLTVPNTGGWETWTTTPAINVYLPAGRHVLRIYVEGGGFNLHWFNVASATGYLGTPYGGTPWALPGLVQAENFDVGGQNVAYYDTDSSNDGGANYRPGEWVDIENCSDTGGGYDVCWIQAGEWIKYTVSANPGKAYTFSARVASAQSGGAFHVEVDGTNVTGTIAVPNSGGWQTWTTVSVNNITLSAGLHVIRIYMEGGGFNFNWFDFA